VAEPHLDRKDTGRTKEGGCDCSCGCNCNNVVNLPAAAAACCSWLPLTPYLCCPPALIGRPRVRRHQAPQVRLLCRVRHQYSSSRVMCTTPFVVPNRDGKMRFALSTCTVIC
jgi:hypothetical protein